MAAPLDLTSIELFRDCRPDDVATLLRMLEPVEYAPTEVIMRQGDAATHFLIVLDGELDVTRADSHDRADDNDDVLATVGPGSILGELALLSGHPRLATITARTPVAAAVGDRAAFATLATTPGVVDHLTEITARRLAQSVQPVPTTLRDGTPIIVRPLLAQDRDALLEGLGRQSKESLRQRFFSAGSPSDATISHLVNINYVDHFAWAVGTGPNETGIATARYIRDHADPNSAEVAFFVDDAYRNHGIATLLLGALAAAATRASITTFVAYVLADNAPMRAVFDKIGAGWTRSEPGVVSTAIAVADAASLISAELRARLGAAAADVVTASGLALARGPQ